MCETQTDGECSECCDPLCPSCGFATDDEDATEYVDLVCSECARGL